MDPTQLAFEYLANSVPTAIATAIIMHQLYSRGILHCNKCENWRTKATECEIAMASLKEREKHLAQTLEETRKRAERKAQAALHR